MPSQRRAKLSRRGFILTGLGAALGSFGYARFLEPELLTLTRETIFIRNLPKALEGLTIAQLTDIHYRPETNASLIDDAVRLTNAENPDIIALTGDFITDSPVVFLPLMEKLKHLRAKHGVFGIMGNHDGWHAPYSLFTQEFHRHGFEFLINEGRKLNINGSTLNIMGTDSIWSGKINLESCYNDLDLDAPVVALVHEPDVFDTIIKNYPVALQLSGHTHGGQCRVPIADYAPIKVKYGENYIYGPFSQGDSKLFVSRGLGTTGAPVRFACPPEIAILTLRSA